MRQNARMIQFSLRSRGIYIMIVIVKLRIIILDDKIRKRDIGARGTF